MQDDPHSTAETSAEKARVCILSLRQAERNLSRCVGYEFEDVVQEIDDADLKLLEPDVTYPLRRRAANRLAKLGMAAGLFNPGLRTIRFDRKYDLGIVMCQLAGDLLALNAVSGLHEQCGVTVCWLEEAWVGELARFRRHLKLLKRFDYIFTSCSQSAAAIQESVQRPCEYLPPGVDAIRFCPYPDPPKRSIDVYNMGRRSLITHAALLDLARLGDFFYVYDTLLRQDTHCPDQHRMLIANFCKRSKFFIANAAKINLTEETHGQGEVGYRFFEGAASGTVMIGTPPNNAVFKGLFPWPDAVILSPFDCPEIGSILAALETQTHRLDRVRRAGILHSLRRHDWVYRWQTILDRTGFSQTMKHADRVRRLHALAANIETASVISTTTSARQA